MTRVFYDTEFLEDGKTIELISIGLVTDDGQAYYAVNSDCPWDRILRHDWLVRNVVPHLPLTPESQPALESYLNSQTNATRTALASIQLDPARTAVKPHRSIANEVRDFLWAAAHTGQGNLELWAWYGAYDHVALAQLWGPMIDLPDGVPMWTNDLRQESYRLGNPEMPAQEGTEHNALEDARYNRVMAQYLDSLA